MTPIHIKKGMNIPLAGAPTQEKKALPLTKRVAVYQEHAGLKPRLRVQEGDQVKRGTPLFYNKKVPDLQFCAPAAGKITAIDYGPRRALQRVVIERSEQDEAETFTKYSADQVRGVAREEILKNLLQSGFLALIRQRPFSRIADPEVTPKSIFVNGMNTAPFLPALDVAVQGHELEFQAGLNALTRLTSGAVHLCLDGDAMPASTAITQAKNVQIHSFSGPHPSGNTSTHIFHIDPMEPLDKVWTVRGTDVVLIGQFLLSGEYPARKTIALGGPGVKESACMHYDVGLGSDLGEALAEKLESKEQRIVSGDALSGVSLEQSGFLRMTESSLTVLPEGREQFFLGWMAPGINKYSRSKAYLSGWFGQMKKWNLTTSLNGSYRSMVLTGLYDKYVPLNIMVDYLVRAVLAHDTDEAIKLGILDTDPEDFALCSFVCPSKMDIAGIIRRGLDEIEQEGI